jgi:hypothetical protein
MERKDLELMEFEMMALMIDIIVYPEIGVIKSFLLRTH